MIKRLVAYIAWLWHYIAPCQGNFLPLPGKKQHVGRKKEKQQEEGGEATGKKEREVERKRLLSLLPFTLHQTAWNPDKHWGSERWRVGATLHHPSPTLHLILSPAIIEDRSWSSLKAEAGHHWRPELDSIEDLAFSKNQGEGWWRVVKGCANPSPLQTPHTQQLTSLWWKVKGKSESSSLLTRYEHEKGRLTSSQGLPPYTYS